MSPNSLLLERLNIACGFVPVNMATGANTGDWVNLKGYRRAALVLFKGAGADGEDPTVTVQQATSAAGAGAKALNFTTIYRKEDNADLTTVAAWTKITQAAANTYTHTDAGQAQAIWVIEVVAADLDSGNDFTFLRGTVADVGATSQIGGLLYLLFDPVHPDKPENMLTPIS